MSESLSEGLGTSQPQLRSRRCGRAPTILGEHEVATSKSTTKRQNNFFIFLKLGCKSINILQYLKKKNAMVIGLD